MVKQWNQKNKESNCWNTHRSGGIHGRKCLKFMTKELKKSHYYLVLRRAVHDVPVRHQVAEQTQVILCTDQNQVTDQDQNQVTASAPIRGTSSNDGLAVLELFIDRSAIAGPRIISSYGLSASDYFKLRAVCKSLKEKLDSEDFVKKLPLANIFANQLFSNPARVIEVNHPELGKVKLSHDSSTLSRRPVTARTQFSEMLKQCRHLYVADKLPSVDDYLSDDYNYNLIFTPSKFNLIFKPSKNKDEYNNSFYNIVHHGPGTFRDELVLENTAYLDVIDAKSLDFYAELTIRNLPKYGTKRDGGGPATVNNNGRVELGLVGTAQSSGVPVGKNPPSFTLKADERSARINQRGGDLRDLPVYDKRRANVFHKNFGYSYEEDGDFYENMREERKLAGEHLTKIGVLIRDGHVCFFLGFDQQTDAGVWKNEIRWQSSGFIYNFESWVGSLNFCRIGTVYTGLKLQLQITIDEGFHGDIALTRFGDGEPPMPVGRPTNEPGQFHNTIGRWRRDMGLRPNMTMMNLLRFR